MQARLKNLIRVFRILVPALAFLIVVAVGAITRAEPVRLLAGALITYCFFFVLGSVLASILNRINLEVSDERLARGEPEPEKTLGQLIDMFQEAEAPAEKGSTG
ncbi:MAG: hypothetical protein AB1742_15665 [bacterium]